jgi:DNA-binding XRE family transcriptional regulator
MEQDDKVYVAALSRGSTPTSARTGRAGGAVEIGHESALGDTVESASAPAPEAPHEASEPVAVATPAGVATPAASSTPRGASEAVPGSEDSPKGAQTPKKANNVRRIRIERMMSKAELARRANLSVLTIDRVERGYGCRVDTKRKILEALGLSLADRVRVFGEEE